MTKLSHAVTTEHEFIDPESGNGMRVRASDDGIVAFVLNGREDEGLYLTTEQLRPIADVLQGIVEESDFSNEMLENQAAYSDPSEASKHDMHEWNLEALEYASDEGLDVTFTYQGERDSYPRQRRVGNVYVEALYDDRPQVVGRDRDTDDAHRNFRLDRIKSHVLVLSG